MKSSKNIFFIYDFFEKYMRYYLIIIMCSINIIGCVSNHTFDLKNNSPDDIYRISKNELKYGHYKNAKKLLEKIDSNYPLSYVAQQAQLDLIHVYTKMNENSLAISLIDRFIRLNPSHKNLDYVLYMRGIIAEKLDNENLLEKIFHINSFDKDLKNTIFAIEIFRQLIAYFPNSKYVSSANNHLFILKERLAKYELSIVKYYNKLGADIAVINRVKYMIKNYPNTISTNNALIYMNNAYKKLGLNMKN